MLAWTVEAAIETQLFDRVLVSTDDAAIADAAERFGAEAPFLREEHADDWSPVSDATITALRQAEQHWSERYDLVVQLMANCPLRDSADIAHAVSRFDEQQRSFQISCFRFGWMNPWWAVKLDRDGHPDPLFPETGEQRSQDLPPLYCPTGATWIARSTAIKSAGSFYGEDVAFEPMDWKHAVDIDDVDDFDFANALSICERQPAADGRNR